jgi:hypothetical protein
MLFLAASKSAILYVIFGESNSGGIAYNAEIPASELLPNSIVRIWNNDTSIFEPLDIGANNLLGHTGLTGLSSVGGAPGVANFEVSCHGLERSLVLDASSTVYLLKSGQGGSRVAQWLPADASGYWNTFVSRYTAARSALQAQGFRVVPICIWWQGVNDAIDGNTSTAWRNSTEAHFARVRTLVGATTPIFQMKIMVNSANKIAINAHIDAIDAADPRTYAVDVSAANNMIQADNHHWTTEGFRVAGQALTASILSVVGSRSRLRS